MGLSLNPVSPSFIKKSLINDADIIRKDIVNLKDAQKKYFLNHKFYVQDLIFGVEVKIYGVTEEHTYGS